MAEDEAEVADAAIPSAGAGAVAAEETAEVLETLLFNTSGGNLRTGNKAISN